jgi:hypothetical protein
MIAVLLCGGFAVSAAPDVTIGPEGARVGDVMFVSFHPESELLRAACSWEGRSYGFIRGGDGYELILPVPLTAKPGARHAMIYWKYTDGGMGKLRVPVQIAERDFGIQHLKLSRSQEKTYSAPETKREKRLIGAALDRVGDQRYWRGRFEAPLEGRISTGFGVQRYINGRLSYRHKGVDIAAPEGTPVKAAADGVVSLADDSFVLHGKTVILDHGQGVATLYIHLSDVGVQEGDWVRRGEIIGRVGETGVATGPHLHFAAYVYHEAVDPFFFTTLSE